MKRLVALAAVLTACALVSADYNTGFEPGEGYTGAAAGVVLAGQQGWYLPASSVDFLTYTYAGNTLNFPQNPAGSEQFIAGVSQGATLGYARAQHAVDFSAGGVWRVTYDMAAQFNGSGNNAEDYLGSFSLQPSATNTYFQTLNVWDQYVPNPTSFHSNYVTAENPAPGVAPAPEWQNLVPNNWYRESTLFDFSSGLILEVSIENLTAGTPPTVVTPSGWHLVPGNGVLPTDVRFFAGGAVGGNTMAWDNLMIPEPASVLLFGVALLALRRR